MNQKIIVYVDDAAHAQHILRPLSARPSRDAGSAATHWVLVACAPRMTHRISKWVSHSARENWRAKWADKLFAQLVPGLQAAGAEVSTVLAKGPLPELLTQLQAEHGADAQVVDARRPKQEAMAPAVAAPAPVVVVVKKPLRNWSLPGTLASLAAALFLVAE
ncbi:universal stress protein [Paracidovorax wautersii]|uniref:universal stress protein n=1 Tax=Paracidovorax wautersii TaxID=1177982 RepID=UPI0031E03AE2